MSNHKITASSNTLKNNNTGLVLSQNQIELQISSIPSPEALEKYKQIDADFPKWYMKIAENEQKIRARSWKNIIVNNIITNIFIIIALAGVIWLCFYIASKEDTKSAAWLGGAILGGGSIFYWLKTNKKNS